GGGWVQEATDLAAPAGLVVVRRGEALTESRAALRARTRHVIMTPVLAAIGVCIGAALIFGPAAMSNPDALVGWGASIGPRTTQGEWWRLVTASFVSTSLFQLLVDLVVLAYAGALVERLGWRPIVAPVYLAARVVRGLAL